jgi:phosphoenolpyruvate carboxykinase (GTP)
MIDRVKGTLSAQETPLGFMPNYADLNLNGLDISKGTLDKLFEVNTGEWKREIKDIEAFYGQFGERFPNELTRQLDELKKRFS